MVAKSFLIAVLAMLPPAAQPCAADVVGATGRVLRVQGYWSVSAAPAAQSESDAAAETDAFDADERPLGELVFAVSTDGRETRRFSVTDVRAYHDADAGMQIFRQAGLRPAVNLRGPDELVSRMLSAPAGEPITVLGSFGVGSSDLTISDVKLESGESGDSAR